jgi:hypothetical protein
MALICNDEICIIDNKLVEKIDICNIQETLDLSSKDDIFFNNHSSNNNEVVPNVEVDVEREKIKQQRKEQRKLLKEKKKELKENNRKKNEAIIAEIQNEIQYKQKKINELNNKINVYKVYKNNKYIDDKLEKIKEIEYEIATLQVHIHQIDEIFLIRNYIRTKLCEKTKKNKECKYDCCTYAHSEEQLRKPKCIYNMFKICEYGSNCKLDHSNSELPEIPVPVPASDEEEKNEQIPISGFLKTSINALSKFLVIG